MNNNLVFELGDVLRGLPGIQLLLQVGLQRDNEKDKVDLLAGCARGSIEGYASPVQSLLKDRWPNGTSFVCDDSVRFDLPIGTGGIALCDSSVLVSQVKEWSAGKNISGQHRPWATAYWVPEALCGDIATAEILYDPDSTSALLKELVAAYPVPLSKAITDLCVDELRQKMQTSERLLDGDGLVELELCISDVVAALVRLAFARSRVYFRGFRSLEQQARLLKPADLALYHLAIKLSGRKKVKNLLKNIREIL